MRPDCPQNLRAPATARAIQFDIDAGGLTAEARVEEPSPAREHRRLPDLLVRVVYSRPGRRLPAPSPIVD